jgi:phosphatidylserine synthase
MIDFNPNPSARELRQFAGIWLPAACGILGGLLLWRFDALTAAVILWTFAIAVAVVGLMSPRRIRLVYVGWMRAVSPIGWLFSHLIVAIVFYVVMTPVGLLLRLFGYNPMGRRFDRVAKTYWVKHDPGEDVGRYFRQF